MRHVSFPVVVCDNVALCWSAFRVFHLHKFAMFLGQDRLCNASRGGCKVPRGAPT